MRTLRKNIMTKLDERLSKYGFERKKKYDTFSRVLNNNVFQNIGFGISHGKKGVILLAPSIGVIYSDVYKIELKLSNLEPGFPDYVGSMIGSTLGHLMPENFYVVWEFSKDKDVTEEANKMADAIIKYGLPYLEELSSRDELIYGLEIGKYTDLCGFMLPIFHYLNGSNKRALECINQFIKKISSYPSEEEYAMLKKLAGDNGEVHIVNNGLKSYLEFVDNFKQMLKQEDQQ